MIKLLAVILLTATTIQGAAKGTEGIASFYGKAHAGRRTASGEVFNPAKLTAAHRTLPFGTRVRVTNLSNGKHVVVRINDRGPRSDRRMIDLSEAAARKIGMIQRGLARVRLEVINGSSQRPLGSLR